MCPDCREEVECPIKTDLGNYICVKCAIRRMCGSNLNKTFEVDENVLVYLLTEIQKMREKIFFLENELEVISQWR